MAAMMVYWFTLLLVAPLMHLLTPCKGTQEQHSDRMKVLSGCLIALAVFEKAVDAFAPPKCRAHNSVDLIGTTVLLADNTTSIDCIGFRH